MKQSEVINVIKFAVNAHSSTNHMYDGSPYILHLAMVVNTAVRFINAIPEDYRAEVLSACWLHDTIEDCRVTFNDVAEIAGKDVAEIVYALTNEKGRNRSERANEKYYEGIRSTMFATFVKLCDRIANVEYSMSQPSRMFVAYRNENLNFIDKLNPSVDCKSMVDYLNELLSLPSQTA